MQMTLKKFEIVEFDDRYQEAIERLVLPIQQVEFGVRITREEQPDLTNIRSIFQTGNGNFWIAVRGDHLVGTIGVVDIGDHMVALKKMFVDKSYRGKDAGVAQSLMDTAKRWCSQKNVRSVLLGTTAQMTAAHRFYEKNGFIEVPMDMLPGSFPVVHVDTKFYRLDL